jgi:hypothetical protein
MPRGALLYPLHRDPLPIAQEAGFGLGAGLLVYGKSHPNGVQVLECPINGVPLYQLHYPGCLMIAMMCW